MARILVVDDEANIRMMIRMALQKAGHVVEQAADGPEGLDRFGDGGAWDLALVDQRMPGMEGLDVLREMRRRDPDARVLMITAFGTVDLAVDAMKAGATDFLRKPFPLDVLRGAVESALGLPAEPADAPGAETPGGTRYAFTTLNGFRIESLRTPTERRDGEIRQTLTVRAANGNTTPVDVRIPPYLVEMVKAKTDREEMPYGDLFWQGFCEEALANYVWQNAAPPPGGVLRVEEYTTSLRRWTDAVLAAKA